MPARPFGETPYTLTNLILAPYDIVDDSFSDTVIQLPDGMMIVAEPESDTDKMKSYGKYSRGLAVPLGSKVNFKAGGMHYPALVAIANATITITGTTPNQIKTVDIPAGGQGMGYFGVLSISAVDDGSLDVVCHKQVMLNTPPKVEQDGENNKFSNWESEGYSYPFDVPLKGSQLMRIKSYESPSDFSVPTDGTEFAAFFS